MALGTPNVYPAVLSWLGIARELVAGQPVAPVVTHPLDQNAYDPEDTPKYLPDTAIRGVMADTFYEVLGVESSTFSFNGPNFLDTHGYFFDNVFGDLSTTGSGLANAATVSGPMPIGATSCTLATTAPSSAYSAGAIIQFGAAPTAEVIIASSVSGSVISWGTGPYAYPLRFPHAAGETAQTATAPFTHRFAALQSQLGYGGAYGAQPPTHTLADVTNIVNVFTSASYSAPPNPYGARMYPSAVIKSLDFSGNAEQLLTIRMQGDGWVSVPSAAAPVRTLTESRPIPNWNSTVTVAGYTIGSSGTYAGIGNFTLSFKRKTQAYFVVDGTQNPYIICRGPLTLDGTMDWDPVNSEMPLDLMLGNVEAPVTISVTNTGIPNSGTPFTLTFTASQLANIKSKITRNKDLIAYNNSISAIANATDTGGSGGLGPGTLTLINNVPVY